MANLVNLETMRRFFFPATNWFGWRVDTLSVDQDFLWLTGLITYQSYLLLSSLLLLMWIYCWPGKAGRKGRDWLVIDSCRPSHKAVCQNLMCVTWLFCSAVCCIYGGLQSANYTVWFLQLMIKEPTLKMLRVLNNSEWVPEPGLRGHPDQLWMPFLIKKKKCK